MTNELRIKNLKLDSEEIDGISFSIDESVKDEEKIHWNITMMKLNSGHEQDFTKLELGYKYQIVLYNNDTAEVFEAIIGDLNYYVTNLVSVDQEGLILKKCKKSEEMLNRLFRGSYLQALAQGLVEVASQKEQEAI
jgi:hypothetical protein